MNIKTLWPAFLVWLTLLSCDRYDDRFILNRLDGHDQSISNLDNRVTKLEELCNRLNTEIASLKTIVAAVQAQDYITGVAPLYEEGVQTGYTISFAQAAPIIIRYGKDGHSPNISIAQDENGIWYWMLDGDWITDTAGEKIPVTGHDGISPQLKIEDDYWYISTDNGATWTKLVKAVGENGTNGDSFFQSVEDTEHEVLLILTDGTVISIPKFTHLSIELATAKDTIFTSKSTYKLNYSLYGIVGESNVETICEGDITAEVIETDDSSGRIEITGNQGKLIIFVYNNGRTIFKRLTCIPGLFAVSNSTLEVDERGGPINFILYHNMGYTAESPDSWIHIIGVYPLEENQSRFTIYVDSSTDSSERKGQIVLRSTSNDMSVTITVLQRCCFYFVDNAVCLTVGESTMLTLVNETSYSTVEWNSSNESIAVVDEFGKVSAMKKGVTEIIAKLITPSGELYEAKCIVSVNNKMFLINAIDAPTAYGNEVLVNIEGMEFLFHQTACYKEGVIQMKKQVSYVANNTAFEKPIISVTILGGGAASTFYASNYKCYGGTVAKPETEITGTEIENGTKYDFAGKGYKFFKLADPSTYAGKLVKISIEYGD